MMSSYLSVRDRVTLFFSQLLGNPVSQGDGLPPYPELTQLIDLFNSAKPAPEVLYLGDSVVERISKYDVDRRTLGTMVGNCLQDQLSIAYISHSAYHLQIFYGFIQVIKTLKRRPKVIILPINLRSFSPQWDLNPVWQLEPEIAAIQAYLAHPLKKVPVLHPIVESPELLKPYNATPVEYALSEFTQIGQFRKLIKSTPETEAQKAFRWQQIFIFHYTHPLNATHPKLRLIPDLLKQLAQMKVRVLFYITPINYCAGHNYVGEEFEIILRRNLEVVTDVIRPYLQRDRVQLLDCSTLFAPDYFFHENDPTEHLNQEGRKRLAEKLARATLSLYL